MNQRSHSDRNVHTQCPKIFPSPKGTSSKFQDEVHGSQRTHSAWGRRVSRQGEVRKPLRYTTANATASASRRLMNKTWTRLRKSRRSRRRRRRWRTVRGHRGSPEAAWWLVRCQNLEGYSSTFGIQSFPRECKARAINFLSDSSSVETFFSGLIYCAMRLPTFIYDFYFSPSPGLNSF